MTKKEKTELKDLIKDLKTVPFKSERYEKIRKKISADIKKKYPNQYVLCTHSKFSSVDKSKKFNPKEIEIVNIDKDKVGKRTVFEMPQFLFVPREEAEYNLEYRQTNVFAYITDGTGIILLKKKEDKVVTLAGGHVDFSEEAYTLSHQELLRLNMQKEIDEEIIHNKTLIVPEYPMCVVNTYEKFSDLFHMAFIYKIEVSDAAATYESLKTGEPNKHDVVFMRNKKQLLNEKRHQWFKHIFDLNNIQ